MRAKARSRHGPRWPASEHLLVRGAPVCWSPGGGGGGQGALSVFCHRGGAWRGRVGYRVRSRACEHETSAHSHAPLRCQPPPPPRPSERIPHDERSGRSDPVPFCARVTAAPLSQTYPTGLLRALRPPALRCHGQLPGCVRPCRLLLEHPHGAPFPGRSSSTFPPSFRERPGPGEMPPFFHQRRDSVALGPCPLGVEPSRARGRGNGADTRTAHSRPCARHLRADFLGSCVTGTDADSVARGLTPAGQGGFWGQEQRFFPGFRPKDRPRCRDASLSSEPGLPRQSQ